MPDSQPGEIIHRACNVHVRRNDDKGTVTFEVSNEQLDRHGTRFDVGGIQLENYKANPVVLYGHGFGPDGDVPVGRAVNVFTRDDRLFAEVEFDEEDDFARRIARKVRGGFLNAASIGFRPMEKDTEERDGKDVPVFTKSDMLEFSVVSVPSNPGALVTSRQRGELARLEAKIDRIANALDKGADADASPADEVETDDPPGNEGREDVSASESVDDEDAVSQGDHLPPEKELVEVSLSDLRAIAEEAKARKQERIERIAKQRRGMA